MMTLLGVVWTVVGWALAIMMTVLSGETTGAAPEYASLLGAAGLAMALAGMSALLYGRGYRRSGPWTSGGHVLVDVLFGILGAILIFRFLVPGVCVIVGVAIWTGVIPLHHDNAFLWGLMLVGVGVTTPQVAIPSIGWLRNRQGAQRLTKASRRQTASDVLARPWVGSAEGLVVGYTGSARRPRPVRAPYHYVAVGPTGCRKSRGQLAPAVLQWCRGPLLVLSTKTDLAQYSAEARSVLQPTYGWDPTGDPALGSVPGIQPVVWDPVSSLHHPDEAHYVADQIVRASAITRGNSDDFWAQSAVRLLAPLLWAARLNNRTTAAVRDLLIAGPQAWEAVLPGLAQYPQYHAALEGELNAAAGDGGRRVDSVASTAITALNAYGLEAMRFSAESYTMDRWAQNCEALYVVVRGERAEVFAPVMVALVTAAVEAQKRYRGGPALIVVDELANICPLPNLAALLTETRSYGVTIWAALQNWGQLAKWGRDAQAVSHGWPSLGLFPGFGDIQVLREVSANLGDELVTRRAHHSSSGDGNSSSGSAEQHSWEPVVRPEHIVPTMPGQVRYVEARRPGPVVTIADIDEEPWRSIRQRASQVRAERAAVPASTGWTAIGS